MAWPRSVRGCERAATLDRASRKLRDMGGTTHGTERMSEATTVASGQRTSSAELPRLPVVVVVDAPTPGGDLELGETIGVGGMGRVINARQVALDRPVAAKFLRDAADDPGPLLREAIVTGRLEHPNIVPVHLLGVSGGGAPFFTMKRVEGRSWSELLTSPHPLVEHLETLVRVCDAVAFAHDRGVLHRDIKPDNVMVGSFGEVYLVDWGLAVSLKPDEVLPLAATAGFAGTPAYMAPEMAAGDGPMLSPRSDVYLLGATLYEVLTGRLPHRGTSDVAVIADALAGSPPTFDQPVPEELAAICTKAMSKRPEDRYQSALVFKQAIIDYLRHREAYVLFEQAQRGLKQLEHVVAQGSMLTSQLGLQAHSLFAECRVGFEQVTRLWPEFAGARVGLQRALGLMIQHELGREEARAARILLAQLDAPPRELVKAVEVAEAEHQAREVRLALLERDARDQEFDLAVSEKRQFSFAFAVVTGLVGVSLQVAIDRFGFRPTTAQGALLASLAVVSAALFSLVVKRAAPHNTAQRRIANGMMMSALSSMAVWVTAWRFDVPFLTSVALYFCVVASTWLMSWALFTSHSRRVALPLAAAAGLSLVFPAWAPAIGGVCGAIAFTWLGLFMHSGAAQPPRAA